jgi:protein dithiol oxidoreductase (disulfide-forming)
MQRLLWIWLWLCFCPILAQAQMDFVEGTHYQVLTTNAQNYLQRTYPGENQVIEFFSYACPWCAKFAPIISRWHSSSPQSQLIKIPVEFRSNWALLAKSYYIAQSLEVEEKVAVGLFDAFGKHGEQEITADALKPIFSQANVAPADFLSALQGSPSLDAQLAQARQSARTLEVYQIPTFIVNGRYQTNLTRMQDIEQLPALLNFLLNKK